MSVAIFSTLVLVTNLIANVCLYIHSRAHKIANTLTKACSTYHNDFVP